MKKFFIKLSNKHELIFKFFLVAASILIIVAALPREIQFNYEVQEDKPWAYENLEAPFDYAILKDEGGLNHEREESLKSFHPFFDMDTTIAEKKIASFIDDFEKEYESSSTLNRKHEAPNTKEMLDFGESLLKKIYDKGIIFLSDHYEHAQPDFIITLLKDHVGEEKEVGDFYTLQTAYNFIAAEVDKKYAGHTGTGSELITLLENSLTHNVLYNDVQTKKWSAEAINRISPYRGKVQKGETIIRKGELVDKDKLQRIESLKLEIKNCNAPQNLDCELC